MCINKALTPPYPLTSLPPLTPCPKLVSLFRAGAGSGAGVGADTGTDTDTGSGADTSAGANAGFFSYFFGKINKISAVACAYVTISACHNFLMTPFFGLK